MKIIKRTNNDALNSLKDLFNLDHFREGSVGKYSWFENPMPSEKKLFGDIYLYLYGFIGIKKFIISCNNSNTINIDYPPESIGEIFIKDSTLFIGHISQPGYRMQISAQSFEIFEVECENDDWLNLNPKDLLAHNLKSRH